MGRASGFRTRDAGRVAEDRDTATPAPGKRPYPRTEMPEKESTARPGTGWPNRRAGS